MVQQKTTYEVEPVEQRFNFASFIGPTGDGVDLLLGDAMAADGVEWQHGGGVGGYVGLEEELLSRVEALEKVGTCPHGEGCNMEIEVEVGSTVTKECAFVFRCPGGSFDTQEKAEEFESVVLPACSAKHYEIKDRLRQWLRDLPDEVNEAGRNLVIAKESFKNAEQARKDAFYLK